MRKLKAILGILFISLLFYSCSKKPPKNTVHMMLRIPNVMEKAPVKFWINDSLFYEGVYKPKGIFDRWNDLTLGYIPKFLDSVKINLNLGCERGDTCFEISLKSIDTLLIMNWTDEFGVFTNHDEWRWEYD